MRTIYNNMHYVYIITSVELDAKYETGQNGTGQDETKS